MIKKKFLIYALMLAFLPTQAGAFCETQNVRINVSMDSGNVQYITTKSSNEFAADSKRIYKKDLQGNHDHSRGLTVTSISQHISPKPNIERSDDKICARLGSLDFKIGYRKGIQVYIDKKYKPGSCEYEITKKHENYHVAVHQQAMMFFKPDIEKKVREIVGKLRPKIVHSEKEAENFLNGQVQQIQKELNEFIKRIDKIIAEKNAVIDTQESYAKTQALCKNW